MTNEIRVTEYFDDRVYWVKDGKSKMDIPIVSVTTKLGIIDKPYLGRWRGDIGNREADLRVYESQQKGKRVHHAWYTYTLGGTIIYNPWEKPAYTEKEILEMKANAPYFFELRDQEEMVMLWKLQRFFDAVKPKVLHSELNVYSIPDDEAGTLDDAFYLKKGTYDVNGSIGLVIPEDGIYIIDLKTGNTIDPELVWMQLAPYINCYYKMKLGQPLGGIILHTNARTRSGIEGLSATLKMADKIMAQDYPNYKHAAALWKAKHPNFNPKTFQFPTLIKRSDI